MLIEELHSGQKSVDNNLCSGCQVIISIACSENHLAVAISSFSNSPYIYVCVALFCVTWFAATRE